LLQGGGANEAVREQNRQTTLEDGYRFSFDDTVSDDTTTTTSSSSSSSDSADTQSKDSEDPVSQKAATGSWKNTNQ
jgi:hypothetical protein